jgi:hypothetical protein
MLALRSAASSQGSSVFQKQFMGSTNSPECVGFLTVRHHPEHGYLGGYLVINSLARPLEFHCSLPLKPAKAQAILYGPTLDEFVCGEQIARALVGKAKSKPKLLFTDASTVLSLRYLQHEPIAYVDTAAEEDTLWRRPQLPRDRLKVFPLAEFSLAVLPAYVEDRQRMQELWAAWAPQIDLSEPFGRIAEALLEAHPSAKAA